MAAGVPLRKEDVPLRKEDVPLGKTAPPLWGSLTNTKAEVVKWLQDVPGVRDVKWLQKQKLQDQLAAVGCGVMAEAEALIVLQSKLPVPHCMQVSGFCTWVSHEFNSFKDSSAPSPFLLPHSLNTSM